MKKLPVLLIAFRILLAPLIIYLAIIDQELWMIALLYAAIISDIFDGIIARHLQISTPALRRADTIADRIFWCSAIVAAGILRPEFMKGFQIKIGVVFLIEILSHLVSYLRFKKEASTHNLLSKLWGILFVIALTEVYYSFNSPLLFNLCLLTGAIARLESVIIMMILKKWDCDIPSISHAIMLRNGKQIKRRKLLNS